MPQNPDEEELMKLQGEAEVTRKSIEAYTEKIKKIGDLRAKAEEWTKEGVVVELMDRGGERKYLNTKRDTKASEFLADKNVYHLARVKIAPTPDGKMRGDPAEDEVEPLHFEGFPVRTYEEDATASNEPEVVVKLPKDAKKKKK